MGCCMDGRAGYGAVMERAMCCRGRWLPECFLFQASSVSPVRDIVAYGTESIVGINVPKAVPFLTLRIEIPADTCTSLHFAAGSFN